MDGKQMISKVLEYKVLIYSVWNVKYNIRKIKRKDRRKIEQVKAM
jgi:hypothetical protein